MAKGFNQVLLQGVLARDPEVRDIGEGDRRARMWQATVANEDRVIGNDGQERVLPWYHRVTVIGKQAEFLERDGYRQGDAVSLVGSLDYRKWDDAETGAKRSAVDVKIQRLEGLGEKIQTISDTGGGMRGQERSLNEVTLIGNLARDMEIRYTPSGDAVVTFGIAVNETWNDRDGNRQERTHWIDINAWRELAESIKDLKKGAPVMVRGRLRNESWVDDAGQKRNATRVEAQAIEVLRGNPNAGAGDSGARSASRPAASSARPSAQPSASPARGAKTSSRPQPQAQTMDDFPPEEEDLPF